MFCYSETMISSFKALSENRKERDVKMWSFGTLKNTFTKPLHRSNLKIKSRASLNEYLLKNISFSQLQSIVLEQRIPNDYIPCFEQILSCSEVPTEKEIFTLKFPLQLITSIRENCIGLIDTYQRPYFCQVELNLKSILCSSWNW